MSGYRKKRGCEYSESIKSNIKNDHLPLKVFWVALQCVIQLFLCVDSRKYTDSFGQGRNVEDIISNIVYKKIPEDFFYLILFLMGILFKIL